MSLTLGNSPSIDDRTVAGVLSEIAEIASETLELQDVFDRVAAAVRRVIPSDYIGVIRITESGGVIPHATSKTQRNCKPISAEPVPLTWWSPRIRPRAGAIPRVDDVRLQLDPSFPADAHMLASGARSCLWEPFNTEGPLRGGVCLGAGVPAAFTDEHQRVLRPIAALLGSAVEHWRIWDRERRRQERLDRVEALLGTLAESLDVREVFQRLSDEMQPILRHDLMVLTQVDVRARTIQITASAGECDIEVPADPIPLTERELEQRADLEILNDIPGDITPDTERQRLIIATGLRSWLRVPVWLSGEIQGALSFFHREPSRYDREDAEVARRLADRISLTLSLHRLAEEARVAAEAQERAQRLEATV